MRNRSAERDVEKERAMVRTVNIFNAASGLTLTEYQGWCFMMALKWARAEGGQFREDDYLDMAAYAALAGECRGNEPRPSIADIKLSPDTVDEIMKRAAIGPNEAHARSPQDWRIQG